MIERFNRTVAQMLATFVQGKKQSWDEYLPFVMLAYRSTIHESTQCTANELMFGRNLALPIDILTSPTPQAVDKPGCPIVYVEWLKKALEESFEYSRSSLKRAAIRQKRYYDRKAGQGGFEVGDWVFRWYPPAAHEKFGSGWTGPYLVVKRLTDLVYKIQASKRAKAKIVHVDHLNEYFFEEGKEP